MRKAERLFQILNLLRNRRRVLTAKEIAENLEVSERTIYRDIQALSLSGVPVEGEAGVGYRLQRHFDLPPLMFDHDEVEALLLGARMIRAWSDRQLSASASSALNKILSVLPEDLRAIEETSAIMVPDFQDQNTRAPFGEQIRKAIKKSEIIAIDYTDVKGESTQRRLWPLGIFFWGNAWTLVAWCELRNGYRVFRLDRIDRFEPTGEGFSTGKECSLEHYLHLQRLRYESYSGCWDEQENKANKSPAGPN